MIGFMKIINETFYQNFRFVDDAMNLDWNRIQKIFIKIKIVFVFELYDVNAVKEMWKYLFVFFYYYYSLYFYINLLFYVECIHEAALNYKNLIILFHLFAQQKFCSIWERKIWKFTHSIYHLSLVVLILESIVFIICYYCFLYFWLRRWDTNNNKTILLFIFTKGYRFY